MRAGLHHGIKVDGGMSANNLLCSILADITGIKILRPKFTETTAFGAALVAAYQAGVWNSFGTVTIPKSLTNGNVVANNIDQHQIIEKQNILKVKHTNSEMLDSAVHLVKSSISFVAGVDFDEESHSIDGNFKTEINEANFDIFIPNINEGIRHEKIKNWREAVKRCCKWVHVEPVEQKRSRYLRLSILPLATYVLATFAIWIFSSKRSVT